MKKNCSRVLILILSLALAAFFIAKVVIPKSEDIRYDPGMSDWMGRMYPASSANPKISTMSIPGTHDSFSFSICRGPLSWFIGKTQMYDIRSQWALGVRSFDVRIDKMTASEQFSTRKEHGRESSLGIFHGPVFLDTPLIQGISEIVDMVKEHPTETAIIVLKFEGEETDDYKRETHEILQKFKDDIVMDARPDLRLDDCRGKVIIIQRYKSPNDINCYISATAWNDDPETRLIFNSAEGDDNMAKLYVQDLYSQGSLTEEEYFDAKKKEMEKCFIGSSSNDGSTWYFNHQSGYTGEINYARNASVMTRYFVDYLTSPQMEGKCTGIIPIDFVGFKRRYGVRFDYIDCAELSEIIISHNTQRTE